MQSRNMDSERKKKIELILLAAIVLTLFTFFPLLNTGFTTNDDTKASLIALSNVNHLEVALSTAKYTGRLSMFFGYYLGFIPYYFDNPFYYKIISLGSILLNLILFVYTIRVYLKSHIFSLFIAIFFLVSIQNSWEHNLVTSYPFVYHLSLSMLFGAVILFKKYVELKNKILHILSAILFLISTLTYETFLTFFVFFIYLSIFYSNEITLHEKNKTQRIVHLLSPYFIVTVIMAISYIAWGYLYPTTYDGAQIGKLSIVSILKVLYQFSISSFPNYVFLHYGNFINDYTDNLTGHSLNLITILTNSKVEWIVKSIISFYFSYRLLITKTNIFNSREKILGTIFFSATLLFLPSFLPALTPKYQTWVQNGAISYTVTYFSFFGALLFLGTIIFYLKEVLIKHTTLFKLFVCVICCGIATTSLLTDNSNYYIAKSQSLSQFKWKTLNEFLETQEFKDIPNNSIIYAPSLWNHIAIVANQPTYWSDYVKIKTGKEIRFINDKDQLMKSIDKNQIEKKPFYFLKYAQEQREFNQYITIAKVDNIESTGKDVSFYSKKVTLYSYTKNKKFYIFGNIMPETKYSEIFINTQLIGMTDGNSFGYVIDSGNDKNPFIKTEVSGSNINIESLSVSYFTEYVPELSGIKITFNQEFSGLEGSLTDNWRWCGRKGVLIIENTSPMDISVTMSMTISSGNEESSSLRINSSFFSDEIQIDSKVKPYSKKIVIPQKSKIEIEFTSDAKRVYAPNDSRYLVFSINNFKIQ